MTKKGLFFATHFSRTLTPKDKIFFFSIRNAFIIVHPKRVSAQKKSVAFKEKKKKVRIEICDG